MRVSTGHVPKPRRPTRRTLWPWKITSARPCWRKTNLQKVPKNGGLQGQAHPLPNGIQLVAFLGFYSCVQDSTDFVAFEVKLLSLQVSVKLSPQRLENVLALLLGAAGSNHLLRPNENPFGDHRFWEHVFLLPNRGLLGVRLTHSQLTFGKDLLFSRSSWLSPFDLCFCAILNQLKSKWLAHGTWQAASPWIWWLQFWVAPPEKISATSTNHTNAK